MHGQPVVENSPALRQCGPFRKLRDIRAKQQNASRIGIVPQRRKDSLVEFEDAIDVPGLRIVAHQRSVIEPVWGVRCCPKPCVPH